MKSGDRIKVKLGNGQVLNAIYQHPSDTPSFHIVILDTPQCEVLRVHVTQINPQTK